MDAVELKKKIVASLEAQGFRIHGGKVLPPEDLSKERMRELHETAVQHRRFRAREGLYRKEDMLLRYIASGEEVRPEAISPRLVEVLPDSEEELLFRYASLHWSIPVSSGYGRRLRYLVIDDSSDKLIGLFGLGDPVFSLSARDEWVGWSKEDRKKRLRHVMDAFVLGAVPPYSHLICGKLVALLATSDEVRNRFKSKYGGKESVISGSAFDGRLAMLTTTSALGRSSLYNRLTYQNRLVYRPVGFTQGSGEFHFSNGVYHHIREYAEEHCEPTAKQDDWGDGFRNRREVIRKCLSKLGFSTRWMYHGVEREVFAIPLARNTRQFLRGEHVRLFWHHQSVADLFGWFRERWLLPRACRDKRYRTFDSVAYRLWGSE